MKARFILDKYVTPLLAVATVTILFLGGCRDNGDNEAADSTQPSRKLSHEIGSRPNPSIPQGAELERPEGWIVRLDRPDPSAVIGSADSSDIFFVNMTPGWHVTTHKAAIFYHPASTADGDYTATSGIYLFDPGDGQREAYGLMFGGTNLASDSLEYGYFLLRNTGEFLIKQRAGRETSTVQDWTASEAVRTVPQGNEEPVLNELSVKVSGGQIHFIVNGENVATHSASPIPNQGIVGFRLNHGLNVHVVDLSVEEG